MPIKLPNGTVIYNVTPHPLYFQDGDSDTVHEAETDVVVNASVKTRDEVERPGIKMVSVRYEETRSGREIINAIKEKDPEALIVGSVVAAQAYPGDVISPIPSKQGRGSIDRRKRPVRSDRFTIFPKKRE